MIDSERIMQAIQQMEWERIKGSLMAMMCTFYDDKDTYEKVSSIVSTFKDEIDDLIG